MSSRATPGVLAGPGIRSKLALAFGVLTALVVIVAVGALLGLRAMHASFESAIDHGLQVERLANEMRTELLEARRAEQTFLQRARSDGFVVAHEEFINANRRHLNRLREVTAQLESANRANGAPGSARIADDLVSLQPYLRVYGEDFEAIVASLRKSTVEREVLDRMANLGISAVVVEPLVVDIAEEGRRHAANAVAAAQRASNNTALAVGAGIVVVLVAGVWLAWSFGKQFTEPLSELARAAEAVGAGDLHARAAVQSDDEIGTLARTFNTMAERLNQSIESLSASEEKYRGIYENSLQGIYQATLDGRLLSANPALARMLGYDTPGDFVERAADVRRMYAVPEQRDALVARITEHGMLRGHELQFVRKDGLPIWVVLNARVVSSGRDDSPVIEGFVSDITEQRRADAERRAREVAEAANRAKGRFLASMSHELRTPLNAILGFAQILQMDRDTPPQHMDRLRIIHEAGKHLLALIDDILDLAKIEAGKLDLQTQEVDLHELLRGLGEIGRSRAEAKQVAFVLDLDTDLPRRVVADERRLRQVLLNLVSNAVKFTDHGSIALRARRLPSAADEGGTARVSFSVTDSGIGIAAEQHESVFIPFEQAGDRERRIGGTGLGLAISRQLVRAMGGDIELRSAPGAGSEFRFTVALPVAPDVLLTPPAPRRIPIGYRGPRRKVLIVDDVPENRALLLDLLRQVDFEVHEAVDGLAGTQAAQALQPDLILMDTRMPNMDGLQATRRLRSLPTLVGVPIIAISASAFKEDAARALTAGANAFLAKPFLAQDLIDEIGRCVPLEWIYREG